MRQQTGRQRLRLHLQPAISDVLHMFPLNIEGDVYLLAMARRMPVQQFAQGGDGWRRRLAPDFFRHDYHLGRRKGFGPGFTPHKPQQIARRLGLGEGGLSQPHPQFTLDAHKQFHARQAVQTKIAFQSMIQGQPIHILPAQP